ncbi:hypothetical protein EHW61_16035 [Salinivibrio sp. VYel6]|uniref:hypothetical protein n=1 Tax=Salinivibrio sp. VYel6 TaxID=2490493 RepID=UPI00128CEB34|nr:hypothetical protein [Salinivibrio sp. VYel6]MPX98139.1 hypothetical protein [Salinivibrio sp. VYel6]
MEKVKVLLELEIDNKGDWLGLDDENGWQSYPRVNTPLDQFNKMAEIENCSALNAILNMCDAETPSRFMSVESEITAQSVEASRKATKMNVLA